MSTCQSSQSSQSSFPPESSHPPRTAPMRGLAMLLLTSLIAVSALAGCTSDGEKKETSTDSVSVKLRRVEVLSSTFSEMSLRVIVALNNPTQKDVQLSGGDIQVSIAGRAKVYNHDDDDVEGDTEAEEASEGESVDGAEDADAEDTEDAEDADGDTEEVDAEEVEDDDEEDADDDEGDDDVDTSDGEGIIDGVWHKASVPSATVPAYAQSEVAIDVTLPLPSDPVALERLLKWHVMHLNVKGTIAAGGAQETFAGRREIGVPVFPRVLLKGAQISSSDGGADGEAYITLEIDNANPFQIHVDKFAWAVTVGGKEMRPMSAPEEEDVPPSSRLQAEDTIALNDETYGKKEVRALLNKGAVPYSITGYYELQGIRKEFSFDGEMAFAR